MFSGRRQPSCDGMSRMMREYHVRFCEGLGVKFPGPTRHKRRISSPHTPSAEPPAPEMWVMYGIISRLGLDPFHARILLPMER